MSEKVDCEFTAGALVRGPVRRFLEECEFYGNIDSYRELKGWLDSKFLIKGMNNNSRAQLLAWAANLSERKHDRR